MRTRDDRIGSADAAVTFSTLRSPPFNFRMRRLRGWMTRHPHTVTAEARGTDMSNSAGAVPSRDQDRLLSDGHRLPPIGLGTYGMVDERGVASIGTGISAGYRLLDTALKYGNEREVGDAVRRAD